MRITGGQYRSRKIISPETRLAEPVPDRIRESVFSILQHVIQGSNIIDLFACSGSLGIESLSRGAESVIFVDSDARAVKSINENLKALGVQEKAAVVRDDAFRIFEIVKEIKGNSLFDIVFLDPPFALSESPDTLIMLEKLIERFFNSNVLEKDGIVFFRQQKSASPVLISNDELVKDIREYGTSRVTFFEHSDN